MYSSRKSKISRGLGRSTSPSSLASASSSSMISLHRSMHSSQMYTPGPAMSFLTCFWLFPQNEHLSRSAPSPRATLHHHLVRYCDPPDVPTTTAHPTPRGVELSCLLRGRVRSVPLRAERT